MKKVALLAFCMLCIAQLSFAQQAVPNGLRYQAIARDLDGTIRANETLTVKAELISLSDKETAVYTEIHDITSGDFGLLNLTIGEGDPIGGTFDAVPWNEQIWVRISIRGGQDNDYNIVTTSKLYSVPYAFYAETAGKVLSEDGIEDNGDSRAPGIGSSGSKWDVRGNYDTDDWNDGSPVLGTTDANDLVVVTNNNPRIVVDASGPVNVRENTDMDGTLNVDGETTLNDDLTVTNMSDTDLSGTLTVGKATTLNDDLTVTNMASTQLTGDLDVDKTLNVDGATTLNGTLDVNNASATSLSGTLTVGQATTLNDDLTVANDANTHLTGDLEVDGELIANNGMSVDGAFSVNGMGATHLTGTLDVDKTATFKGGLTVEGLGTMGPNGDHLAFFDNTEGGNSDGIGIRIATATNAENNFLTFYKGDNSVAGRIEGFIITDIGLPPAPTDDEIWSAICVAIADYNPVTIVWTQFANNFNLFGTIWNGATIPAFEIPDFPGLAIPDFPGLVTPNFPGLVTPNFPGLVLPNFPGVNIPDVPPVSIPDVGQVFGGLTLPDIPSVNIPDIPSFNIPDIPSFNVADIPAFPIPDIPAFPIPDVPEINLSADLFEVPTIPTFSDILVDLEVCPDEDIFDIPNGYVYRLVEWGIGNDMQSMITLDPIDLAAQALIWGITKVVKDGGVSYGSKGADYAEYLPKMYASENFLKGEVVGVHGGRISRVTEGADQILAISTNPLVLGNQPEEHDLDKYEKVGFLGQVPVYVEGNVEVGDYIIPSGKNDGRGKAIKAHEINADILPQIIGKAWSASEYELLSVINVSIGLRPTEIAEVLRQREQNLVELQERVNEQATIHDNLIKDVELLKEHIGIDSFSSGQK